MALDYILDRLASERSLKVSTPEQRAFTLRYVNRAAEQIWGSDDLVLALREQYIELPTDDSQVALPYYVGQLRGVRRPNLDPRDPIALHDMRPRYHYNSWGDMGLNTFRIKQETPLARSIENFTPVTFTLPEAQSADFTISVTGATNMAAYAVENLVVPAGTTTVTTSKVFTNYKAIRKSARTTCDITATDGAGNVISVIPNILDRARYLLVNISESSVFLQIAVSSCYCVEMLYKPLFIDFYNDEDTFGAEGYDNDIFDLTDALMERDPLKKAEKLQTVNANLANKKDEFMKGQRVPMNMAPDPWVRNYENMYETRINYGYDPRR